MAYQAICLTCQANGIIQPLTWTFYICSDCEKIYGKTAEERPDWLNFMINDEAKIRRRLSDVDRTRDGKELYIYNQEHISMATTITPEMWLEIKEDYAFALLFDSDLVEIKDSDWEALYNYGG